MLILDLASATARCLKYEEKLEKAGAFEVPARFVECAIDMRVIAVPVDRCTIGVFWDERVG